MVAKVTGRAKYAEDFRADGMLFARQLLSPLPHARIRRLDTSAALALPGVKAIVTADDLPKPAGGMTDLGVAVADDPHNERALTSEPLYEGEPILAVAAVDESTAAEAIERIVVEYEPLPHVIDPLVSLRPGGPNARTDGNVWQRKPDDNGANPFAPGVVGELEVDRRRLRRGRRGPDAARQADPRVEVRRRRCGVCRRGARARRDLRHAERQPSDPRAAHLDGLLGERQALHALSRPRARRRRFRRSPSSWGSMPTDVVVISEYTGGGFGSKITGDVSMVIPALLSKKANAPVMMRISRDEEHYMGGARPALVGRVKAGFTKEGKLTALDLYVVSDNGPYEIQGDAAISGLITSLIYQAPAMRFRSVSVLTNTPPRVSQSQPGGMQGITIVEPMLAKAARQLKIDQVAIRKINAPEGKAAAGPPGPAVQGGMRTTSAFMQRGPRQGRGAVRLERAQGAQRPAHRLEGPRRRRGDEHVLRRVDRVRRPARDQAGRPPLRAVGHRELRHRVGDRRAPGVRRDPRRAVGAGRGHLGQHRRATCRGPVFQAAARRRTR